MITSVFPPGTKLQLQLPALFQSVSIEPVQEAANIKIDFSAINRPLGCDITHRYLCQKTKTVSKPNLKFFAVHPGNALSQLDPNIHFLY
jgi:hypothetical protein